MKKRYEMQEYKYGDARSFKLHSINNDFQDTYFWLDRKAVEVLASRGEKEFQKSLIGVMRFEMKSYNFNDSKEAAYFQKNKRRIRRKNKFIIIKKDYL